MTQEQLKNLLSQLCEITVLGHKELLTKSESFMYEPNTHKWAGTVTFPSDSYISYKGMSVTESGGTYWLKFAAENQLKAILDNAKLPTKFCTFLMNERFRKYVLINADDDLKKLFYMSGFQSLYGRKTFDKSSVDEKQTDSAIKEIDKLLLLPRIKFS